MTEAIGGNQYKTSSLKETPGIGQALQTSTYHDFFLEGDSEFLLFHSKVLCELAVALAEATFSTPATFCVEKHMPQGLQMWAQKAEKDD